MRENLFRGKRRDNGEWVYGSLFVGFKKSYICPEAIAMYNFDGALCLGGFVEVSPESVGQYTGLHDATKWENLPEKEQQEFLRNHKKENWNGKRIFEGDIIKSDNGRHSAISVVKFGEYYPKLFFAMLDICSTGVQHLNANGFYLESTKHEDMILFKSRHIEVIGNVHDNPDLLLERKEEK